MGSLLEARGAIEGASVLDLFCGSGALSLEMLSRGAAKALAVDRDPRLTSAVATYGPRFGVDLKSVALDLLGPPRRVAKALAPHGPWDLILVDPPYAEIGSVGALLAAITGGNALARDAYVVVEHAQRSPATLPPKLATVATYRYGDTGLTLATMLT